MKLTPAQLDRACRVLLATAAGDALGAGYEFGPSLPDDTVIEMAGGGPFGWKPGEWTDDTAMAIAIAETAATGADLRRHHGPRPGRQSLGGMGPDRHRRRLADQARLVSGRRRRRRRSRCRVIRAAPAYRKDRRERSTDANRR